MDFVDINKSAEYLQHYPSSNHSKSIIAFCFQLHALHIAFNDDITPVVWVMYCPDGPHIWPINLRVRPLMCLNAYESPHICI